MRYAFNPPIADILAGKYDACIRIVQGHYVACTRTWEGPARPDALAAKADLRDRLALEATSPGQRAYESELRARPVYHDGKPRKTWAQLGDLERSTWERDPTPRWTE